MSDEKNKVTDKASEIARSIWLAGVGAYGRAVEEAQGRLEKAMEPPKLFRDLVKVGAALEEDARQGTVAARHSVEERINRVRENFHNQRPARIEDLAVLHRKIDQLSRKVERLSNALRQLTDRTTATAESRRKVKISKKPLAKADRADKKGTVAGRVYTSKKRGKARKVTTQRKAPVGKRKA